jgi:hypothetical protein
MTTSANGGESPLFTLKCQLGACERTVTARAHALNNVTIFEEDGVETATATLDLRQLGIRFCELVECGDGYAGYTTSDPAEIDLLRTAATSASVGHVVLGGSELAVFTDDGSGVTSQE